MELYLQFGHGMMEHCRALLSSWNGGTAILSPRDLTHDQLVRTGASLSAVPGGESLLDPQFYLPHADHKKLCQHDYWPKEYNTAVFWQGTQLSSLLRELSKLNREVGCKRMIAPGLFADSVDGDWLDMQKAVIEESKAVEQELPLIVTIALSAKAVQSSDQVATLLERTEDWNADAYYLVCEHPDGQYLVEDPNWLANVLDLSAGLRLNRAEVILGYCTHQMLIASAAKVSAIASGTWMNVRSFPPDKFVTVYEDEIKLRKTWYYCPQALSEYGLPFLDIAHRLGLLGLMAPPAALDGGYVTNLFSGAQPSTVGFGEQSAFRHYLHSLRAQCRSANQTSLTAATADHQNTLDVAERLLQRLRSSNVSGQLRDFHQIVDVNRAALGLFGSLRGPILSREWNSI
jgi:hypothetical protein